MKKRIICFLFLVSFFLPVNFALADTIYLTSGEQIKGYVVEDHHDRVVISTYKGEIPVLKISIDQIFFDSEEQNYQYLGDKALEEGDLLRALGFYQKSHQINPESEKITGAFLRLNDAINRKKLQIEPQSALGKVSSQLGLSIAQSKDKIKIVSVKKNSVAQKAQIVQGDFITDVWGYSVMFMNAVTAADNMAGATGTPVKLGLEKDIVIPVKSLYEIGRIFPVLQFRVAGFSLSLNAKGLVVDKIYRHGFIEKTGLHVNDVITHINGIPTRYMPLSTAKRNIYQSRLKEVTLTVKRQVTLIRGGNDLLRSEK